ncbi:MAG: peptidylprolyl isomerase [Dysgonamonadaceae bacterium]|nr:peptidylprolyl isomerase [Dysgonamonadaceae bacterium]MDD4728759.1 peptidylprolyl isomerase [Dysgonamonadaceae bacterium]
MKIETNKYVILSYDLHVGEDEERELMESATKETPLEFIFGTNSMLQSFEEQLEGKEPGDNFKFTLTSDEAYGEFDEEKILELPKNIFEVDGEIDNEMLFEGNTIPMMDTEGNRLMGSIVEVNDDVVSMDFNHPLSGETLHFEGNVIDVRDATPEEIASLFAEDGGGCSGCSDDGCGDRGQGCN